MHDASYEPPLRLGQAIDLYLGHMAQRSRTRRSRRDYERQLLLLARAIDPLHERTVDTIRADELERFLARWRDKAPSTLATNTSILRSFFAYLEKSGRIVESPAAKLERPLKKRPEYTAPLGGEVSSAQVEQIILACQDFQELLCVAAAAFTSRRRTALANARRSDADLERGLIRFTDKGDKAVVQPIPDEFLTILREAEANGVWEGSNDYLIPNRRRATTNQKRRSSKVIYETVKKVAERVGIRCSVHPLRAAFAVKFLESELGGIESLKELMGHDRIETTMVYLRRLDREQKMESVRTLSWSGSNREQERRIRDSNPCQVDHSQLSLPDESPLKAKLDEMIAVQRDRSRDRRS